MNQKLSYLPHSNKYIFQHAETKRIPRSIFSFHLPPAVDGDVEGKELGYGVSTHSTPPSVSLHSKPEQHSLLLARKSAQLSYAKLYRFSPRQSTHMAGSPS
mmetsp:Transcript_19587/g.27710  ORF Transcript_19587/g.27710 Transcript_19587/m.27710 type:complete len:101 (-) Transcript_19587:460-762(-)